MINKSNYIGKTSRMSLNRIIVLYIHQCFRNVSLIKLILILVTFFLFIIYFLFFNLNHQLCDPEKHLWWFCPWPDPQTTVCTWNEHFPMSNKQIRSPESYENLFSSVPKVRSSFEYNNLTLIKCNEDKIDILIFVISKCEHFSIRQSIRRTWANLKQLEQYFPKIHIKLLFLVDMDSKSSKKIELEYIYHEDIVQVINLPEQYEYVTEREASIYQYINQRCKQSKYLFKTDDDIFINTFLLLIFFQEHIYSLRNYSLFGFPIEYGLVVRHTENSVGQRYIITKDEYPCSRYPIFLSGFGYFMSKQTSSLFFNAYLTDIRPFPLSDVYFTGLLAQMFHIERETIFQNVDYRYETKCNENFFTSQTNPFACAASDDHFNVKESGGDRSLMNDYNLYWTILTEKYHSLRTNHQQ